MPIVEVFDIASAFQDLRWWKLLAFNRWHMRLEGGAPLGELGIVLELCNEVVDLGHALVGRGDFVLLDAPHIVRILREVGRQVGLVTELSREVNPAAILVVVLPKKWLLCVEVYLVLVMEVLRHANILVRHIVFEGVRLRIIVGCHTIDLLDTRVVRQKHSDTRLVRIRGVEATEEILGSLTLIQIHDVLLEDGVLHNELRARVDVQEDAAAGRLRRQLVAGPVLQLRVVYVGDGALVLGEEELRESAYLLIVLVLQSVFNNNVETL